MTRLLLSPGHVTFHRRKSIKFTWGTKVNAHISITKVRDVNISDGWQSITKSHCRKREAMILRTYKLYALAIINSYIYLAEDISWSHLDYSHFAWDKQYSAKKAGHIVSSLPIYYFWPSAMPKNNNTKMGLSTARPFSRIMEWGRAFEIVCRYFENNALQAWGFDLSAMAKYGENSS